MNWFKKCRSKAVERDMLSIPLPVCEKEETSEKVTKSTSSKRLTYHDLTLATENFKTLIGEGVMGRVYKGQLESKEVIVVKQLKQCCREDLGAEVLKLNHPNVVTYIDYCTDEDQRLLVYKYMPMGSLKDHLFDLKPNQKPLDWNTRLKIAVGVARGLEYLHCKTKPRVCHRNLKPSNILLDNNLNPKLSDVGMEFILPNVRRGFKSPYDLQDADYRRAERWTLESDIYSFGVLLLKLITGRTCVLKWSPPILKDREKYIELVDPLLEGRFPVHSMQRLITLAAICLQECGNSRPCGKSRPCSKSRPCGKSMLTTDFIVVVLEDIISRVIIDI